MAEKVNVTQIPGVGSVTKKVEKTEIALKNVLFGDGRSADINVEVVPFDCYDVKHVEFAYSYSDMLFRAPSPFKSISEAAQSYVAIFMVHKEVDKSNPESNINRVYNDLRACRTLFHQPEISQALDDFFVNA